jgi:hypothetical protein
MFCRLVKLNEGSISASCSMAQTGSFKIIKKREIFCLLTVFAVCLDRKLLVCELDVFKCIKYISDDSRTFLFLLPKISRRKQEQRMQENRTDAHNKQVKCNTWMKTLDLNLPYISCLIDYHMLSLSFFHTEHDF